MMYVNELGKCYNKSEDGHYRLYKEPSSGMWAVYMVGREFIWNEDGSYSKGKKLEAVFGGYLNDPEYFEDAIYILKDELRSLAKYD